MLKIGFSTGALGRDNLSIGVDASVEQGFQAIELSALRHRELPGLIDFVERNRLAAFSYVSLHAPTDYTEAEEATVAASLLKVARERGWYVVIHPDCIKNVSLWKAFGDLLCIENMDKRKPAGRTVEELKAVFDVLQEARLCFDIAHAYQVDATMTEAYRILRDFGSRICQLHVSEVTSSSKHDRISDSSVRAFRQVLDLLPRNVPVILETPVPPSEAMGQVRQAERIFAPAERVAQPA